MNTSINFDSQVHCFWFKHEDLWHINVKKRDNNNI